MPVKTHAALAPSTASRILELQKNTQFVLEGLAEDQQKTQQHVESVERLCKNVARKVTSLHRRVDAAESHLDAHKRQLEAVDADVRNVRQRTDTTQSTLDHFLQRAPGQRDEPDAWKTQQSLDFFNMTDAQKDQAKRDFRAWACKNSNRLANLHKEKTQGLYGAYITCCPKSFKFFVFRCNTCMRAFFQTFQCYGDAVAYRRAVLDMFEIELVENIPTQDPAVRRYRMRTKFELGGV